MGFLNSAVSSVNAAALLLGAASLLSRALGVFRDRLLAAQFGAGRELDIYYAAFQIPDFMSVLFLLGAGSAAILPIFQEYLARDRALAKRLISDLVNIFSLGALFLSTLLFFVAPWVIPLLVPGFSFDEQALTVTLTRIMLLSPILLGISTIFSSVVESFQRFFTYACAPILYNLGIVAGIVFFVPRAGLPGLAMGVALGAVLHAGINFFAVRRLGFAPAFSRLFRFSSVFFHDGIRKVMRLSFPRVLSISLSNLTLMALVFIGSTLEKGSIAIFQLAQNLYTLPIGIFGVSYAVALFPQMSRAYMDRNAKDFFEKLFLGVKAIFFWVAPSVTLFIVLRAHMVRVALGAGAFSWEDTRLTAAVLAIFACAMMAGALSSLLIKGFYALENTWIPLAINACASLLSVGASLFFIKMFSSPSFLTASFTSFLRIGDLPYPQITGLALGFAVGLSVNIFFLYRALRRLAERTFRECYPFPFAPLLKIIFAALVAGGVAYGVRVSFSETLPLITFFQVLAQGISAGAAGFLIYFGTLALLREETVFSLAHTLRTRIFRVKILPQSWDGESQNIR